MPFKIAIATAPPAAKPPADTEPTYAVTAVVSAALILALPVKVITVPEPILAVVALAVSSVK